MHQDSPMATSPLVQTASHFVDACFPHRGPWQLVAVAGGISESLHQAFPQWPALQWQVRWGLLSGESSRPRISLPTGAELKLMMCLNHLLMTSLKAAGAACNWTSLQLWPGSVSFQAGFPRRPGYAALFAVQVMPVASSVDPSASAQGASASVEFLSVAGSVIQTVGVMGRVLLFDPSRPCRVTVRGSNCVLALAFQDPARDAMTKEWANRLKAAGFVVDAAAGWQPPVRAPLVP